MNDKQKKLVGSALALVAVIVLLSMTVRFIGGSETLSEYAKDHPDEQVKIEVTPIAESEPTPVITPTPEVTAASEPETEETEKEPESESEPAEETYTVPADYPESPDRVTYAEGFYYEPIPDVIRDKMKGVSYPLDIDESKVNYDVLRYVRLKYIDFDGNEAVGEMVCNQALAQDIVEIFHELYLNGYQIQSIRLIDDFDADDTASMIANNTSCFCYRVVEGSTHLSNHAYGRAIDLNPFYNPYIVYKSGEDDYISPPGSEIYVDRTADFPQKIDENDLAYKLWKQHGFKWGGDWTTQKDYQHFEKKSG